MLRQLLFTSIILALITNYAGAQRDSARNHLMIVPSYFSNNALRIDYEVNIGKRHWLQLSPQYYFGNTEFYTSYHSDYELNNLSGYGLDIDHKIYVSPGRKFRPGTYFSYGIAFNYLTIQYTNTEGTQPIKQSQSFPKIGGDLMIGFDFAAPFSKFPVIFGPYAGIGYRYSFTDDAGIKKHFTKSYYDFAYSGNLFIFGFKIGAWF